MTAKLSIGFILPAILACGIGAYALKPMTTVSSDIQKETYFFRQAWVWSFRNEWIPEGEFGSEGEMTVYYDPDSKSWLFTAESYGITDEMAEWIIAPSQDIYISAYQDEFGNKHLYRDTLDMESRQPVEEALFSSNGNEYLIALDSTRVFGTNSYGWPTITATAYAYKSDVSSLAAVCFLAETELDFSPLYLFNSRSGDARLPIHFPQDMPGNRIVAQEITRDAGRTVFYRLEAISDTEYHINFKDYERK
ncbi:hypothetical protein J2X69_002115 [Algoriphagus sp. 4150]|uniref:hypothetical protein n=1 Tax=Algoriphagus sp. 4150 TaxID=2817756 RepID=UPI002861FEFE|nr:hypothetical protein [Algoriphagus sp. 4150]MDR7129769.1 hypothetical protein [Algoriphagus sp. 4150]